MKLRNGKNSKGDERKYTYGTVEDALGLYSYVHVRVYFMQVRNLQRFHTVSTRITNALAELEEQLN